MTNCIVCHKDAVDEESGFELTGHGFVCSMACYKKLVHQREVARAIEVWGDQARPRNYNGL